MFIQKGIAVFFYQILYMTIIATIVGIVILCLRKIIHKRNLPKYNYIIWAVFMIALVCPISIPSKVSIYNYLDINQVKITESPNFKKTSNLLNDYHSEKVNSSTLDEINMNKKQMPQSYLTYLKNIVADIWFVVCIMKLISFGFSYRKVQKEIGKEEVQDERILNILESCKQKLKIKRNIKMIRQNTMNAPCIIGVWNVRILFDDYLFEVDDETLTDVFMHELSHYKRKDHLINFLGLVMRQIYWFNPLIKVFFEIMKKDIEFATDELALSKMEDRKSTQYCKALVYISELQRLSKQARAEMALGWMSNKKNLLDRVNKILEQDKLKRYSIPLKFLTILVMLVLLLFLYPSSYGAFSVPKLYLETENGEDTELLYVENDQEIQYNTVYVKQNEKVELLVESGKSEKYIGYQKIDCKTMENCGKTANILLKEIECFNTGEFLYEFTVLYGNNAEANYCIKIVVE